MNAEKTMSQPVELNMNELEQVNGGMLPVVIVIAVGAALLLKHD